MTESALETIKTIAWCVVLLAAVQGVSAYALVRILTTGRSMFERKPEPMRGIHDGDERFGGRR